MRHLFITLNGQTLSYYCSDQLNLQNTPIFLHGWGSEAQHLKILFQSLNNYLAIDLPGFGQSQLPNTPWGLEEYAEMVKLVVNTFQIKSPILIGHSFGGSIALQYALKFPQVKKLILIDSAGLRLPSVKKSIFLLLTKLIKPLFTSSVNNPLYKKFRNTFYRLIGSEDFIEAGPRTEIFKKIIAYNLRPFLPLINTETILIWGANDWATPLKHAHIFAKELPHAKLEIIPKAGHFCFIDQPQAATTLLIQALNDN
ncbi:MAG: alpha/beta hydrolase [Candidatus Falkowbacteria bacterium]